jgi:AcrR family transcriptional regulator
MARPAEPLIDREKVIRAAVVLLDRSGPEGLSMRALANHLNVAAPSLYHHFRNKAEILDGVARWIFLETRVVSRADDEWMSSLADQATALVEVILDHPKALPLLITAPYRHFDFRMHEFSASHLVQAGVPDESIIPFFEGMYALAIGLASTIIHSEHGDHYAVSDRTPNVRRALDASRWPLPEQIRTSFDAFISGWISHTAVAQPARSADRPDVPRGARSA